MQLFNKLVISKVGGNGVSHREEGCLPKKALHEDCAPWDSASSPPPLDEVTACSSSHEDDSSSVSSLDSIDHILSVPKPRSLFKAYWETSGGRPRSNSDSLTLSTRSSPALILSSPLSQEFNAGQKSAAPLAPLSPNSRRRIFSEFKSASAPCLPSMPKGRPVRKCRSASSIPHGKPKESCLRPSRFSGRQRRTSDASDSSVSVKFSTEVDIVVFETPAERWAAEGWANWFA